MSAEAITSTLEQHIRAFFAGHQVALQQFERGPAVRRLPTLRVLESAPGPRSATWTYVTRGAWEANPQNPFEYLMTGDRARPRYCELLTIVAFYALSTTLGIGHTMPIGEPLLDGSFCQDIYLSLPYTFGPKLERFALDGREGQILWVFPLTPLEKKFLLANGVQALEDRLEASKVEYWSPFRPSVI